MPDARRLGFSRIRQIRKPVEKSPEAIRAGADYLVVGRPILGAADPAAAAHEIVNEISGAW